MTCRLGLASGYRLGISGPTGPQAFDKRGQGDRKALGIDFHTARGDGAPDGVRQSPTIRPIEFLIDLREFRRPVRCAGERDPDQHSFRREERLAEGRRDLDAPDDLPRYDSSSLGRPACPKPRLQLQFKCRKRHGRLGKPGQFPINGNSIRHFVVGIHGRTQ